LIIRKKLKITMIDELINVHADVQFDESALMKMEDSAQKLQIASKVFPENE
jgi:hypothetical protein